MESALQVSRDLTTALISKHVESEHWLITYDHRSGSASGSVFRGDTKTSTFLDCAQADADVESIQFACFVAEPCALAPCTGDQWSYVSDVTLPRAFFAQPEVSEHDHGCVDLSGSWRVGYLSEAGLRFGEVANIEQTGCTFELAISDLASGTGRVLEKRITGTLAIAVAGAGACPATVFGTMTSESLALNAYRHCDGRRAGIAARRVSR